jgi:hypothetical protein
MIKIQKVIIFIFFFLMMSGFSLISSDTWEISQADPTLWIKICDATLTKTFTNDLNSSSDTLGTSDATGLQVLTSVIKDYNDVNSAYLRFAQYPVDPNNPGAPSTGDSTFTTTKAATRTITVCISDTGGVATGGYAKQASSGKKITGCDIKISPKNAKTLKPFVDTLTHELGHCAGLDHPMETKNAIMSYFHPSKNFRLMTDDKMGLVYLFPVSGTNTKEKSTFGLSCAKN